MEGKTLTPIDKALEYLAPRYDLSLETVKYLLSLKVDEKEAIIDAANYSTKKNKKLLESKGILTSDKIGENYYNTKYNNGLAMC
jgi:hypothetical protein